MRSKKEVIEEAWGEDKIGYSKETGWATTYCINGIDDFTAEMQERFDFEFPGQDIVSFRPKSLRGIEDNNGWVKINSEEDLPKIGTDYWVINSSNFLIQASFLLDRKVFFKYGDIDVTHYQPIQKPNPPIYKNNE